MKQLETKQIIAGIIVAIILGVFLMAMINNPKTESKELTKGDVENFCQDSKLLGQYLDMEKVNIIDVANYNPQLIESGDQKMLTWNGKVDGKRTGFVCSVSGSKEEATLRLLEVGGKELYNNGFEK